MAHLTLAGKESYIWTAAVAAPHVVSGKLALPLNSQGGGGSGAVVTVTQNSTTVFTSVAGSIGFRCNVLTAVGDTITVAITSSNGNDTPPNALRCDYEITQGV